MDHHNSSVGGKNEAGAVEHWRDMECRLEYMKAQVEEAQQALARKHLQQQELVERAEQAQEARQQAEAKCNQAKQENDGLRQEIEGHVTEKLALAEELAKMQKTLKETNAILIATQHTESCLAKEANQLIQALKKSIQDGQELHSHLLQKRDEEVERKAATIAFNESIAGVFANLSKELDGLSALESDFGNSISNSTKDTCNRLIQLLSKQQQSIEGLSKHVQQTSSVLKSHMEGNNGIVPTVQATTASARVKTKKATETLRLGEGNITASCNSIRDHLEVSADRLDTLDSGYHEASSVLLKDLHQKLSLAEHMLKEMVSAATSTLAKRAEDRRRSSEALQTLVSEWQNSSHACTGSIMEQASIQSSQVLETLQMLMAEMARHDEIDQQLSNQREFLKETGIQHTAVLQKQSDLLASQRQIFEMAEQRNKESRDQFMSNVMRGVQDLIQNQMAVIETQSKKDFESLVFGNEEIIQVHDGIQSSSQSILGTVSSTNGHLQKNFQEVRENEYKAAQVLQQAKTGFNDIQEAGADHLILVNSNVESVQDMLTEIQASEKAALESCDQDLQRNGKACTDFVVGTINKTIDTGLGKLEEASAAATSFVKSDVIRNTNDFVANGIEKPFGNLVNTMKETLEEISVEVQDGDEKIRTMATEHGRIVDRMSVHVDSSTKQTGEDMSEQQSIASEHQVTFLAAVDSHERIVNERISTAKADSSNCASKVGVFTHEIIRPHEETAEAAQMEKLVYSEDLSKTPSADVIIREFYTEESSGEFEISDAARVEEENEGPSDVDEKENHVENIMYVCESDEEERTVAVLQEQKKNRTRSSTDVGKQGSLEPPKRRKIEKRNGSRLKKPRTRV